MFTGIIEETGIIESINSTSGGLALTIKASKVLENTSIGDSIALNGVCLTVTKKTNSSLTFFVMHETAKRTNLAALKQKDKVNLERAATLSTRLGGHLVSGHIDATSTITSITKDGEAQIYSIALNNDIEKYIIHKGSVAIDGISLTVMEITNSCFKVSIIPHTQTATTLICKKIGDTVNIECDLIAKHIERLLPNALTIITNNRESRDNAITMDFLEKNGF